MYTTSRELHMLGEGGTDLGLDPPNRSLPANAGRHVSQVPDCARWSKRPLRSRGEARRWGGATTLHGAQNRHHIVIYKGLFDLS